MFHFLKKTVQPFKIIFNGNNTKLSTINVSSTMSQPRFPFSNQMSANYSKRIHNGLILEVKDRSNQFVIQRKNASKSSAFAKLSVILSKVGQTVEKKYFYTWSKPDMTLFKNRGIIMLNGGSKIPPEEFLACDLISVILAAGTVLFLLSLVPSGPSDPKAIMAEVSKKVDKNIKKAQIELEYWTALEETIEECYVIVHIGEIFQKDTVRKALQEMDAKPKEELSPQLAQIKEKFAEMPADIKVVKEAIGDMTKCGSIWYLTEAEKQTTTQNLRRAHPTIKQVRKKFEEIHALIQTLSMEDLSQNYNDKETKPDCNCS